MRNLIIITGVRPQYMKASALLYELDKKIDRDLIRVIDVGQHYDQNLSDNIITELGLKIDFKIRHFQTSTVEIIANSLLQIEQYLKKQEIEKPIFVVFGDANPAIIGSILGLKLGGSIVHIEAGARRNCQEQEHCNSKIIDCIADLRLCVTQRAYDCLEKESLSDGSILTGDMAYNWYKSQIITKTNFNEHPKILITLHRAENTNENGQEIFDNIVNAIEKASLTAVWINHPRANKFLSKHFNNPIIKIKEPLTFLSLIQELNNCSFVLTDSGGVAREAHYLKKPILMRRDIGGWQELKAMEVLKNVDYQINDLLDGFEWAKQKQSCYPSDNIFYVEGGIEKGINAIINLLNSKGNRYV